MMAEYSFQEVMKQWRRMCNGQLNLRGKCPLAAKFQMSNCTVCKDTVFYAFEEAETIIMAWAAEHPEPVYPTWEEWLSDKYNLAYNDDFRLAMSREHIPADDAQKLGIKPKEK